MKKIYLSEQGILTDTDVTVALVKLFEENPNNTIFVFEPGNYYFSPHPEMEYDYRLSNTNNSAVRKLGLWMRNMENCIFQGNGAKLYFSGQMQAVTMDHCKSLQMENFVIDWKKPLVAEGIVVGHDEKWIDLYIDPVLYPHRVVDDWIEFDVGNQEWYPLCHHPHVQFEGNDYTIPRDTGEKFWPKAIKAVGNNVYRFMADYTNTSIGNVFVLRHNARVHAGLFTEKCEDIIFSDITVHSCGGLGCLAQFCHNLTYQRVHFIPNSDVGRKVTNGRDDGMHITCCSGKTIITECTFIGLMDDPINVHGCCVTSEEIVDDRTIRCKYKHQQSCGFYYWAKTGDEIAFIERRHMAQLTCAIASSYVLEDKETFLLVFEEALPNEILDRLKAGEILGLDNLTNTTSLICTKNRFGSCRARGLLVSTPKPVLIAENYFQSSGSAILIPGDSNYWFESGECHDIEIRDNIFTDACLTSIYGFCEGIISIYPSIPEPETDRPYHKNIRIFNNVFDTADTTVLYSLCCAGLTFTDNLIFKSSAPQKSHKRNVAIRLKYCREVALSHNKWIGQFGFHKKLEAENCFHMSVEPGMDLE